MKVAIAVEGEVTTRAAQSLSSHPDVEVVLLAPANSSQFEVVDTPEGCVAVFGAGTAVRVAAASRLPAVTTAGLEGQPGVAWASIQGLALALASDLDSIRRVAAAIPGEPGGDETVVFPSPIDGRHAMDEKVDSRHLLVARGEGSLASALALGGDRHRAIMDDHRFMEAIALAAGVGVLGEGELTEAVPVWERSGPYLQTAAEMGLVIGERTPA